MYMPNASPNARGPNATYIPLARVGSARVGVGSARVGVGSARVGVGSARVGVGSARVGVGSARVGVGSARVGVGSARLFRDQYVGISNPKSSRWGPKPTRTPSASCFALQWNICFNLFQSFAKWSNWILFGMVPSYDQTKSRSVGPTHHSNYWPPGGGA